MFCIRKTKGFIWNKNLYFAKSFYTESGFFANSSDNTCGTHTFSDTHPKSVFWLCHCSHTFLPSCRFLYSKCSPIYCFRTFGPLFNGLQNYRLKWWDFLTLSGPAWVKRSGIQPGTCRFHLLSVIRGHVRYQVNKMYELSAMRDWSPKRLLERWLSASSTLLLYVCEQKGSESRRQEKTFWHAIFCEQ